MMDNDKYSEEGTSAESTLFPPSNLCELCKNSLKKSQAYFCKCCYNRVCGSCSVTQETSLETLCSKCQKSISKTYENLQFTLQQLKNANQNLTISMMESMQERQEIRNKMKEKAPKLQKTTSIKDKIQRLKEDFYDSFMVIMNKQREKRSLIEKLNQKQCTLFDDHKKDLSLNFEIKSTEIKPSCRKDSKDDMRIIDSKTIEQENMILEEQIKDLEIEYDMFYRSFVEALQCLRAQIIKEKDEKPKEILDLIGTERIEDVRENIKLLREELQITQDEIGILAERYAREHKNDVEFIRNFEYRKRNCSVF
ncbi:hypothetical protein SteCoe_26503 [Stentor coeruleus]|uniref:FYVE-type domain-containing protein n=1 Tax=Stentor coeruleus TaxID=5963 RepID=A0A1R2BCN0_9CILI|nr:hypothetical protein SteCoe_26503 [Stentor coeruleus]